MDKTHKMGWGLKQRAKWTMGDWTRTTCLKKKEKYVAFMHTEGASSNWLISRSTLTMQHGNLRRRLLFSNFSSARFWEKGTESFGSSNRGGCPNHCCPRKRRQPHGSTLLLLQPQRRDELSSAPPCVSCKTGNQIRRDPIFFLLLKTYFFDCSVADSFNPTT